MTTQNENEILIMKYNQESKKWFDITSETQSFSGEKEYCILKFNNNDTRYTIKYNNISIIRNPIKICGKNHIVLLDDKILEKVDTVLHFDKYYKILYLDGKKTVYAKS